jgi:hypothetical protein
VPQAVAGPSVRRVKLIDDALLLAAIPEEFAGWDATGAMENTQIGLAASIPHAVSMRKKV